MTAAGVERGGPVLAIESSTARGSVAVIAGGELLARREVALRAREVERLMPAVAEALEEAGLRPSALGAVLCGAGPGSFTGLRIGGAIAKGLAHAAGLPLLTVPSLLLLAAAAAARYGAGSYLASADALRDERFVHLAVADASGTVSSRDAPPLLPAAAVVGFAASVGARVIVPGDDDLWPDAAMVAHLRDGVSGPVALASWEPTYGRLAEAQVKWEREHGRPLPAS